MTEAKPWYESKTIWFNALAILVLIASQFGFGEFELDQNTIDTVLKILAGITAVTNVGLRFVTEKPVSR